MPWPEAKPIRPGKRSTPNVFMIISENIGNIYLQCFATLPWPLTRSKARNEKHFQCFHHNIKKIGIFLQFAILGNVSMTKSNAIVFITISAAISSWSDKKHKIKISNTNTGECQCLWPLKRKIKGYKHEVLWSTLYILCTLE